MKKSSRSSHLTSWNQQINYILSGKCQKLFINHQKNWRLSLFRWTNRLMVCSSTQKTALCHWLTISPYKMCSLTKSAPSRESITKCGLSNQVSVSAIIDGSLNRGQNRRTWGLTNRQKHVIEALSCVSCWEMFHHFRNLLSSAGLWIYAKCLQKLDIWLTFKTIHPL